MCKTPRRSCVFSFATLVVFTVFAACQLSIAADSLFPRNLDKSRWVKFSAEGFSKPVTGIVFNRDNTPCCGCPVGGVATGCMDIDTRGVWGYNYIFNGWSDFFYIPGGRVPRMEPPIEPIFGLAVGDQTWALTTEAFMNGSVVPWCTEPHYPGVWTSDPNPRVRKLKALDLRDVKPARDILYWGHFPVVDMEFVTDSPVEVGARIWSSFLPGNAVESNIPGAVFEVRLRNKSSSPQTGAVAMNFPGPNAREARSSDFHRKEVSGPFNGVVVSSAVADVNYALGVIGDEKLRVGGGLNANPNAWSKLGKELPGPVFRSVNDTHLYQTGSASVAVDFSLEAGAEKTVRFVLAWYAPVFEGAVKKPDGAQPKKKWKAPEWMGGTNFFKQMYATRYISALDVAMRLATSHEDLLSRVLAWQRIVYEAKHLPGWLQDALINNLSLIAEDGYWAQPQTPLGDWAYPFGVYALNESSRGCPHLGNMPSDWYGTLPLTFFYPDLHRSELNAFMQYQSKDGEVPFALGAIHGLPDLASPEYYWQKSLNGMCYVDMVDRLWQRTGDRKVLEQFYESVKGATTFTMKQSSKPGFPIRMPDDGGMEWFEHGEWAGMATHMGGLRLAMLSMAERMATSIGDKEYSALCRKWLDIGQDAMENKMWTDAVGGYYLNFWEPETNKKSDDIMAYALDGEWAAQFHGLAGVFNARRVEKMLQTIRKFNVKLTPDIGAANFCRPDGSPLSKKNEAEDENINQETKADVAHYGAYTMFSAEVVVLGMTYMLSGERDFGLEMVRKHWENLLCIQRHPWDFPNMMRGDNGERLFGTDYYQCMMLWALPAAIEKKDIARFTGEGGLVDRMIRAAQGARLSGK